MAHPGVLDVVIAAAVLGACDPATTSGTPADASETPAPAAAKPELPAGVLAEAEGKRGLIRVEERDGLRQLTIDGVVQGAVPVGDRPIAAEDPMVGLVRATRPKARRALVIGLGTGATATQLAAAGLEVEVAELEPKVVELAREHFGYDGHAEAVDGLTYLEQTKNQYDVILVDAFHGKRPASELVDADGIEVARVRLASGGLLAIRLLTSPRDPSVGQLFRRLGRMFTHIYGTGVGDEDQNVFVLSSKDPVDVVDAPSIAAWPIVLRADDVPEVSTQATDEPAVRSVTVVGYLIRERSSGALALDLPHWQMGAIRYMLTGARGVELAGRLPAKAEFPTQGDIRSDGDVSGTAQPMLGGGGVKRSDVRFSPIVVAVRGRAQLRSVIHPDAVYFARRKNKSAAPAEPRLPYGGSLYELEVDEVLGAWDRSTWTELQRGTLRTLIEAMARAVKKGDLDGTVTALDKYNAALEHAFGASAAWLVPHRFMTQVVTRLRPAAAAAAKAPKDARPFAIAVACDRATPHLDDPFDGGKKMRAALVECAQRHYQRALQVDAYSRVAAGRLLALWEHQSYGDDRKAARRAKKAIANLRRKHPAAETIDDPPIYP